MTAPAGSWLSRRFARWLPFGCVLAVSAWCTWSWRANRLPVAFFSDATMHEQMVRYATRMIQAGRLPLTGWYPYLNLGSPQFLHYQSLGAMLAGLVGTVTGPDTAFRWSLWLLVGLWPFAVYGSARVFGLGRPAAAAAAVLAPFLWGSTSVGYEQPAYSWLGYGVWAQLVASWVLPFAWAVTWRALHNVRLVWLAGLLIGVTVALHYETGYLALMGPVVLGAVAAGPWQRRLVKAAGTVLVGVVAAAWTLVPLVLMSNWAAINPFLAVGSEARGYGAGKDLAWLFTGQTFDTGRWPLISVLVLVGTVITVAGWRRQELPRGLLCLLVASLLLSFGPATWGPLASLVPGHADMFFRRFVIGVQLAGLYLAGIAAVAVGLSLWGWLRRLRVPVVTRRWAAVGVLVLVALGLLWPAYSRTARYDRSNAASVSAQLAAQRAQGRQIAPLLNYIRRHGGGRTYAGADFGWGVYFLVGQTPVYAYLADQDIDEVGYGLRTNSLMSAPEVYFADQVPADYTMFGVRYLILPAHKRVPVPARRIMSRGNYVLWDIPGNGYATVVRVVGTAQADRADVAASTEGILQPFWLGSYQELAVEWPGQSLPPDLVVANQAQTSRPGRVVSLRADLLEGQLAATVSTGGRAVVMFSVSYDPGWEATVDGRPAPTVMLAPALVGVPVGPGYHRVALVYHGFGWYPELAAAGALGVVGAAAAAALYGRRRRRPGPAPQVLAPIPGGSPADAPAV